MTFSIVARTEDGALGVAVATRFLAVGARVPAVTAGTGALATQSYANLAHHEPGMLLLRTGVPAQRVIDALLAADPAPAGRQLGVVGATGSGATFTGAECHPWAGGETGDGWAVQGNLLTGSEVVTAMRDSWLDGDPARSPSRRLLAAVTAGEAAGGDRRGRQSAALLVASPDGAVVDLRVDDHPDPVSELSRLLALHEELAAS